MTTDASLAGAAEDTVLLVLSDEQRQELGDALQAPSHKELIFESNPENALDRVAHLHPSMVAIGMEVDGIDGLEILAMLLQRYREFSGKVIVLPMRGDPFPPIVQYRDAATGRSVPEEMSLDEALALIRGESGIAPAAARPARKATVVGGFGDLPIAAPEAAPPNEDATGERRLSTPHRPMSQRATANPPTPEKLLAMARAGTDEGDAFLKKGSPPRPASRTIADMPPVLPTSSSAGSAPTAAGAPTPAYGIAQVDRARATGPAASEQGPTASSTHTAAGLQFDHSRPDPEVSPQPPVSTATPVAPSAGAAAATADLALEAKNFATSSAPQGDRSLSNDPVAANAFDATLMAGSFEGLPAPPPPATAPAPPTFDASEQEVGKRLLPLGLSRTAWAIAVAAALVVIVLGLVALLSFGDDETDEALSAAKEAEATAPTAQPQEQPPAAEPSPADVEPAEPGIAPENGATESPQPAHEAQPSETTSDGAGETLSEGGAIDLERFTTLPMRFVGGRSKFEIGNEVELATVIEAIRDALGANPAAVLEIGGHASEEGSRSANRRLGARRADQVREYLISQGIARDRLVMQNYGTRMPLYREGAASWQLAENRRVTVRLIPKNE